MKTPRATVVAVLVCLTALLASTSSHLVGSAPAVGTNQWVAGPPLGAARSGATGIALAEGGILVTGGRDAAGTVASAEIVTPNGTVVAVSPMGVPRAGHAAVRLDDGRVLVVGGTTTVATEQGATEVASNSIEIFDPLANIWAPAGALMAPRALASAFRVEGGRVAIAGSDGSIEIFDPAGSEPSTAITLGATREGAAIAALRDGRIVVAGGSIGGVAQASADIVDTKTGVVATVSLTGPRTGATATATVDGRVLIAGGSDGTNVLATTEILDDTGNASSGPALTVARADHQAYLLPNNGGVLLVGGSAGASPEVVIPWTGAVIETPAVNEPRTKTAGGRVAEGAFAVAGGSTAGGAMSAALDYYGFATVKTDKDDYAPGQFVTITGTGWQPGETVNLVLHEVGTGAPDTPLNAVADENGNIFNDFWAPNESHIGVRFHLTALGAGATAQTTFTDANIVNNLSVNPGSLSVVRGQTTAPYTITVNFGGNSSPCTAPLVISGLPTGAVGNFSPTSVQGASNNTPKLSQLTISTTDGGPNQTPTGSTTFTVTAQTGTGCDGAPRSATGILVVTAPTNAAPAPGVISGNALVNEGGSGTYTSDAADADGDALSYTWSVTSGNAAVGSGQGTSSVGLNFGDGPSTVVLHLDVNDGHGHIVSPPDRTISVANVVPTATFGNNGPVNEGAELTVAFTGQVDPSSVDVSAGLRYSYSCSNNPAQLTSYASASTSLSTTCTFQDNGTFPVLGRIIDKDGGFTDYTTNVVVNNVAPSLSNVLATPATVNEGGSTTLTGNITDPGTLDAFTLSINWGDGSATETVTLPAGSASFSVPHTFVDDNPTATSSDAHTVSVTVTDDDAGADTESTQVTVNNVAPTVDAGAATATADEGTPFARSGSFTDPGTGDTWTATVDYGDGTGVQALTLNGDKTFNLNHAYADNGSYTVTVKVTDDDLGEGTDTIDVTVDNVVPVVSAGGDATVDEGAAFTRDGSFTDPGADSWTATVDYGDGDGPQSLTLNADKTFSLNHTYADNGSYTVTVKVTDDDSGEGVGSFEVTVNNVAPTVDAGAGTETIAEGATFARFGSFTDPGADTWTATVDYGDGAGAQPLTLNAAKTFSLSHTYDDNGSFTVTVKVKDDDSGEGTATIVVTVDNVAPSATLANNGPVAEGSGTPVTVTFSGATDPSGADTTAGFKYAFRCANNEPELPTTYAAAGTDASMTCTFGDNGSPAVLGRIFDKDNGYSDYTTVVTVTNVAPTKTSATFTFNPYNGAAAASVGFSDAGWLDVVGATFDWAGTPFSASIGPAAGPGPLTGTFNATHTFGPGCIAAPIAVTVSDDDGGSFVHQFAAANTLGQYTSTFMAPLKDGARNIVKLNNVIPVKLIVRDCNGNFVSNRTLSIFVTAGILNVQDVVEGTELIPATSVSGADTTGVMRLADSHYMYNLATKGMTTGLPYTIVIKDGTFVVATAVVEAKK